MVWMGLSREEEAVYTSGVWNVKEGREEEFERRWQESANATVLEFPDVKFMLLRDRDDPRRFVSLSEGWRNAEQIKAARSSPGYQDAMAAIWRVLESGEIATLDLVAETS
jgi:quinol monooxygenase YgiN